MQMREYFVAGVAAVALMAIGPGISASTRNPEAVPTHMVITVLPGTAGNRSDHVLEPGELTVLQGNVPAPVLSVQRLTGDLATMQLVVLLDDSTQSASLGTHLGELKTFLESLPATTQVSVGYMRNGIFPYTEAFTTDHQKAASALRPPLAIPGANGSPYFALSQLVKQWPSKQSTGRRAVLMLTDGVDPYYGTAMMDDPYVDTAVRDAVEQGVTVYAIYLRGAGSYGEQAWVTNMAQSRLEQLTGETGGEAYFQDFTDPVTIAPFLNDFQDRMNNQYEVTIAAVGKKGLQPVKLRAALPGLKIRGPERIYVR